MASAMSRFTAYDYEGVMQCLNSYYYLFNLQAGDSIHTYQITH